MSHVNANPHMMAVAAGDLASVLSNINAANANAKAGTTVVPPPGGDSVSAFLGALFSAQAQAYQAAGAHAATYHDQFVQAMRLSAGSYASTEATNASPLQKTLDTLNAASQSTAGHLISNGANSAGHLIGGGTNSTVGHLINNGANAAASAAPPGGVGGPLPAGGAPAAPSSATPAAGAPVAPGGDAYAAAGGGPQSGGAGGGGGGGGASGGGGGGGGELADPRGAGGWYLDDNGAAAASGTGFPGAWGSAAPTAPWVPGLAHGPAVPAVVTGGYPAAAGLAGLGAAGFTDDATALSGLTQQVAPEVSAAAGSPAAEPAMPTAPKAPGSLLHEADPLHQGHPAHPGDATQPHDGDHAHDKAVIPIPLPPLRLPSLRGLRGKLRLGLRDKEEWHKELREAATKKPWGREELLGALGLRPPGSE